MRVNSDFEEVARFLPENTSLTSVKRAAGLLTVSGIATDETNVFAYARNLENGKRFNPVTISSIRQTEKNTSFILTLGTE